jgi:hypothetical protein
MNRKMQQAKLILLSEKIILLFGCLFAIKPVTIQAVIARAFFARSNLVLNRKNHALGDCFTRKKRSFAVTPLFRVDG